MVSRRKILSRSRDDLNLDQTFSPQEEEEDVWYQKDKLYKEHIQEVLDKWTQIDDEIWAKVIVFERNRRVAKAYARAPVLTINGSDDGFDGMRIGLCGFDNPMRDPKTEELKKHIGQGVKIKMDDAGNILIRRYAKSNVYVKSTANNQNEETSIGADILKLPNQALESEKIVKLFDMKKFQSNVNRELRRAYPDRRRLETQCLSAVAFVKSESDILECPIWVLIVNVVAMDMLKSKLPPVQRPIVDIKNRPRIPIPDEDPYSVAGNGSGGSSGSSGFGASAMSSMMSLQQQQQLLQQQQSLTSNNNSNNVNGGNAATAAAAALQQHLNNGNGGVVAGINGSGHVAATREQLLMQSQQLAHKRSEKPPKLPPRDNIYGHDIPKPDYDDIDVDTRIKLSRGKSDKGKDNKKYDDPYYCGLRARVPNFVKSSTKSAKEHAAALQNGTAAQPQQHMNTLTNQKKTSIMMPMHPVMHAPPPPHMHPHHIQQQQMMAAVAAHAVAQQQQQQHHPIHHHHAAQQHMWQTRSYESGIGIYNHNQTASSTTTATTKTAATTATGTNFNTDLQLQQLQQQQTSSSLYYPSTAATTTASSSLYNYLAPQNYNEHYNHNLNLQQQQKQQQLQLLQNAISSSTSHSNSATSPIPNAPSNNNHVTLPSGHMTNTSLAQTQSPPQLQPQQPTQSSIQLSTNLTFATTNPIEIKPKSNTESIYGQTRNLNFKQVNSATPNPQYHGHNNHHHRHHQHHYKNGHSHHSHNHHQRRQHHGSYGCLRHPAPPPTSASSSSHTPSRSIPGEFYYKPHDRYYDDYGDGDDFDLARSQNRPLHFRPSRRSSSATAQIGYNCNCVSCYTLAPLVGAPTPKRPPRSLSQQQLRQHQRLSGAKSHHKRDYSRGVVKWCSDSDVSLLGREELEQSEEFEDYRSFANSKNYYDNDDDFSLDQDFDIENFNSSQMDYKKQIQKPKQPKFNGYAAKHKYPAPMAEEHHLTDGYVDKARLRQIRSPTPKRKQSQTKEPRNKKFSNTPTRSNLLTMRTKSQSTESFFEQPHEEGSIYLYGGRKRIQKAPSTTNLYDHVKSSKGDFVHKQAKKYNSQLNLNQDQRSLKQNNLQELRYTQRNDHDTIKPLLPPPMWRGAKRMNLKGLGGQTKLNNHYTTDLNNNNVSNKIDFKLNNQTKTDELTKTTNLTNNSVSTNKTTAQQTSGKLTIHNSNNDKKQNENETLQQQQTQSQPQKQTDQQQQPQLRMGRSSSRGADISDMESIYGYLKPRKPRSLSMKKIQILDY